MGASFWANWSCSESIASLRNLILPLVLAEGYDLLTWNHDWQMFDRGGIDRKLAWGLSGGRWSESPTVLTVSYSRSGEETVVTLHWHLSVKPLPTTPEDKQLFEEWVRKQMQRVVTGLRRQLDAAEELKLSRSAKIEPLTQAEQVQVTGSGATVAQLTGTNVATALKAAANKGKLDYASACYETIPTCSECQQSAMPVPGAAGRYYCLTCKRHLSRQPIA